MGCTSCGEVSVIPLSYTDRFYQNVLDGNEIINLQEQQNNQNSNGYENNECRCNKLLYFLIGLGVGIIGTYGIMNLR